MEKAYFEFMAKFNQWSNNKMNNIISNLTVEQWEREFTGFYKTIHEICAHIYFSDYITLNRFNYFRHFNCLNENSQIKEYLNNFTLKISEDGKENIDTHYTSWKNIFSDSSDSTIAEYIKMRDYLDDIIIKFVDEVNIDDLGKMVKFTTVTGNQYEQKIGDLIMELFVHQIHNRGMISVYLDMMGIENEFNDAFTFAHEENARKDK